MKCIKMNSIKLKHWTY
ncbi:hypothetical protein JBL43_15325 [Aureibaculum sp. A20]|uniref:Uncharacterized protein n=1 Tax=Aureibaculum flavum TaxID=2795986 RepID=A0ABS0WUF6_9FLAO|nr:hypothetical protein [Aureibaculum flavum]